MTVRDTVLAWLRTQGMTRIFGNPGSTELPLFRNFPQDFSYTLALHEGCAVAMADGYAQASGAPAFVNLHSAAGVGNAMGTIFTAWKNRTPLLITAGQQARSILLHDPFLHSDRPTELVRPYVKYAVEPARAEDVPQALVKALQIALTPPMGPVFVSIPADDWDRPAARLTSRPAPIARTTGDIAALADALGQARNPAIVAGGEIDRSGGWNAVVELAERSGAAVWHAPLEGRVGFPQSHSQFAGTLPADPEGIVTTFAGHDLILVIGTRAFTYHVEGPRPFVPANATLFVLSENPETLAAAVGGQAVLGDIGRTVSALLETIPRRRPGSDPALDSEPRPQFIQNAAASSGEGPGYSELNLSLLLETLHRLRDPASAIIEEAPTSRGDLPIHLPIDRPASFFTCASGGLGFGLPAAVGVAVARPEVRTIALIGDGSAMYSIQALHAVARENANLLVLILNNRRYAALDSFAERFQMRDPPGCDLQGLDFVGLAQAQGVAAKRVETPDALEAVLINALEISTPMLVEVVLP